MFSNVKISVIISRHVGDLGNVEVCSDGVARVDTQDSLVQLDGQYSVIGRSIVVRCVHNNIIHRRSHTGLKLSTRKLSTRLDETTDFKNEERKFVQVIHFKLHDWASVRRADRQLVMKKLKVNGWLESLWKISVSVLPFSARESNVFSHVYVCVILWVLLWWFNVTRSLSP